MSRLRLVLMILLFSISVAACGEKTSVSRKSGLVVNTPGNLIITEVGSNFYNGASVWFEVYNNSAETANAALYSLRTTWETVDSGSNWFNKTATMQLPQALVPAGGYLIVRGDPQNLAKSSDQILYIRDGQGYWPIWKTKGFIELLRDGATNDFVDFGAHGATPTTGTFSGSAPALPSVDGTSYGYSIARDGANTDTDIAGDWGSRTFATPGGPNDVTCTTDADADGIPDCSEDAPGATFAGLPLYDWGARAGKKDIFIEVDWMNSTNKGTIPNQTALEMVVSRFATQGIALHFDVGGLFNQPLGTGMNLGGGNVTPFRAGLNFEEDGVNASLYSYKAGHMDIARKQIFHYMLFAHEYFEPGPWGVAERPGNDSMITMGGSAWLNDPANLQAYINHQAKVVMHEFGHNLGLTHGGGVNIDLSGTGTATTINYKPNYVSIMNYLYGSGLPTIGTNEGDRYYNDLSGTITACSGNFGSAYGELTNNPDSATFVMDFSHGLGADLVETSIVESAGLRQPGSTGVDYDCDGTIETIGQAIDVNPQAGTGGGETLRDHNDWANLIFVFQRDWWTDYHFPAPGPKRWVNLFWDDQQPYIVDVFPSATRNP